jgi:hypothetical protein
MWVCTWWEMTGDMTSFDDDGISSPILRNLKTGERLPSRALPIGALYAVPGHGDDYPRSGRDGLSVYCKMPAVAGASGGFWNIESRCSNCTAPDDGPHRCWVRHGTVGEAIHVDKVGLTCAAGAGSIQHHGWHGFLHDGVLSENG